MISKELFSSTYHFWLTDPDLDNWFGIQGENINVGTESLEIFHVTES